MVITPTYSARSCRIAGMEDMKKVGKTGGYALLYFEGRQLDA